MMTNHGQNYLDHLERCAQGTFENCFSVVANKLGLSTTLGRNELLLLYEAAFSATRCNLALNGLNTSGNHQRVEPEHVRSSREQEFLVARDVLFASPGWTELPACEQEALRCIFLGVAVRFERLN